MSTFEEALAQGQEMLRVVRDLEAQMIEAGLPIHKQVSIALGLLGRVIAREDNGIRAGFMTGTAQDQLYSTVLVMRRELEEERGHKV